MRTVVRHRTTPTPFGCRWCGYPDPHGRQYLSGRGMHGWERPTDEQIKARMRARREGKRWELTHGR